MRLEVKRIETLAIVALVALAAGACSGDVIAPEDDTAELLSMVPAPGAVDVSVGASVDITFDHAIGFGMREFAALHEGSLTGPVVDGTWALSEDRTVLMFTPDQQLKAATTYVVHLGAGMTDEQGHHVGLEQHGVGMGGQWATQSMMTGGGMGSGMGSGMGENGQMMGDGWAHPTNGSYGMVFSFTTAG